MQNEDQEVGSEPRLAVHTSLSTRLTERRTGVTGSQTKQNKLGVTGGLVDQTLNPRHLEAETRGSASSRPARILVQTLAQDKNKRGLQFTSEFDWHSGG